MFTLFDTQAQSDIKVNGFKVNHLDKQKKKQGDWIFFDKNGNVRLSCFFQHDSCISPLVFYENSDTVFVRYPFNGKEESFVFNKNNKTYFGDFIHTSDSTITIELDPDPTINENIIEEIKYYKDISLEPVYFFSQQKIIDYMSASFHGSNFSFNKPICILLTIYSSGIITRVEFPRDKNNLSEAEERELYWIYSTMPRWQPYFSKNKAQTVKVLLTDNSSLSILSFGY